MIDKIKEKLVCRMANVLLTVRLFCLRIKRKDDAMSKKIRTIKKRRVCRFSGCKQKLSIYNPETHCYVHQHATMSRELSSAAIARC